MQKFVFLDLEGTIIDTWDNHEMGNIQKVRQWLKNENVKAAGIFSFAVDNEKDKADFKNAFVFKALEEALGVMFTRIVTVEEVRHAIMMKNRVKLEDLWEVKQLWGKERGFIDFCFQHFNDCECVLLDDLVNDMTVTFTRKNLTVRTVNVDDLRV